MDISISTQFKQTFPQFKGAAVMATVKNSPSSDALWKEIAEQEDWLCANFTTESIKHRSGIATTRQAYKAFGKDPSRYRPACEQLARRVLQGKGLYHVDTIVDLVNLVSLVAGYSTAALDADKIVGNVTLGIGEANEPYEGIGRGVLNIEHLPVYRDAQGAFATPTSDSVRTMMSADTKQLLVLINGYDGNTVELEKAAAYTEELLKKYAEAENCTITYFLP